MDLSKLKVFHAVAKLGGIKLAVSELKMRESSISTAISNLEASLGYKLFIRHHKGMRLNKEGEKLYKTSQNIFEEVSSFLHSTQEKNVNKVEGDLTIATSQGIAASAWFTNKMSLIVDELSDLRIKIINYKEGDIDHIKTDILLCPYVYGRLDLIQDKVHDFNFAMFASRQYIKKYQKPETFDDLDNHRLVAFSRELENPFNDVDSVLHIGREKHSPRDVFLEINNSVGLLKLIKNSVGIGCLVVEDGKSNDLIPLLGKESHVSVSTYLTYRKERKHDLKIKAFCDLFKED